MYEKMTNFFKIFYEVNTAETSILILFMKSFNYSKNNFKCVDLFFETILYFVFDPIFKKTYFDIDFKFIY